MGLDSDGDRHESLATHLAAAIAEPARRKTHTARY